MFSSVSKSKKFTINFYKIILSLFILNMNYEKYPEIFDKQNNTVLAHKKYSGKRLL